MVVDLLRVTRSLKIAREFTCLGLGDDVANFCIICLSPKYVWAYMNVFSCWKLHPFVQEYWDMYKTMMGTPYQAVTCLLLDQHVKWCHQLPLTNGREGHWSFLLIQNMTLWLIEPVTPNFFCARAHTHTHICIYIYISSYLFLPKTMLRGFLHLCSQVSSIELLQMQKPPPTQYQ